MSRRSKSFPQLDSRTVDKVVNSMKSINFQFLTFTDFNQSMSSETKKKVRSHVGSVLQSKMKSRKEAAKEAVLDISSLLDSGNDRLQVQTDLTLIMSTVPSARDLPGGRSDLCTRYPINMDLRSYELFDQLCQEECHALRTLNKIGFFRTALLDKAAFRQLLYTSSTHSTRFRHEMETSEDIALSTEAIRSLHSRLTNPDLCTSDGVVITILTFICHAIMFDDRKTVLTHFNGLEEIIRRRGGLETFRSNPVLRTVIFWIDVKTAFLYNRVPRFPVPVDIRLRVNALSSSPPLDRAIKDACYADDIASSINELFVLTHCIKTRLTTGTMGSDDVSISLLVACVIHRLLSVRYDTAEVSQAMSIQESCRIGILLYLTAIRYGFDTHLSPNFYVSKLKHTVMSQGNSHSEITSRIKLWLLVIGGIQSLTHKDHNWFVLAIASLIVRLGYHTWYDVMTTMRQTLWIEGMLQVECDKLHKEVLLELGGVSVLFS